MSGCCSVNDNKINGFDKWEITNDAETLIKAEKIKNDKRKNYLSTVLTEVDKQVKAAEEALLNARTIQRLGKVFKKKKKSDS